MWSLSRCGASQGVDPLEMWSRLEGVALLKPAAPLGRCGAAWSTQKAWRSEAAALRRRGAHKAWRLEAEVWSLEKPRRSRKRGVGRSGGAARKMWSAFRGGAPLCRRAGAMA